MMSINNVKKISYFFVAVCLLILVIVLILQYWISAITKMHIYSNTDSVPNSEIAVVLGTSRYLQNGKSNPYYQERINGAVDLYTKGKVQHLIVSGDNQYSSYNEPRMMAQDLVKKGVPQSAITYDFAGFRTLDSVIRANKVFDLTHFTLVTQQFHCERALFIAKKYDLQVNCFAVPDPAHSFNIRFREYFARLNTVLDLYLFNTQPKFLGELESISLETENNN